MALVLASTATAGNVLRVGAGRPFLDIQPAINAASNGDIILVDPGTYSPFQVGTSGSGPKVLSIFPSSGTYSIVALAPGTPEILVEDILVGHVVTIAGAEIDYDDPLAPAVLVRNCTGAVRFSALQITKVADLLDAPVQAVIEVEDVNTFWLSDSSVEDGESMGYTSSPLVAGGLSNDGISALQTRDSEGTISNCRLYGYHNFVGPTGYAGDGARFIGDSAFWLAKTTVGGAARFAGGDGLYGGHAIHQVRDPLELGRNTACSSTGAQVVFSRGFGTIVDGGRYGMNNSNGFIGGGWVVPNPCDFDYMNEASVLSSYVHVPGTLDVKLYTFRNRDYSLVISDTTRYALAPPMHGREMLRFSQPPIAVANGTTQAGVAKTVSYTIPNIASLIGMQLTVQARMGPVGGAFNSYSLPSLAVLGP